MPAQTQSLIKFTRGLLSVGLLFTGIFSFGSLTLVQTNAAQAHLADANCQPAGSPFYFENCWWRKKICRHTRHPKWSSFVTTKVSCPDLNSLNQTIRPGNRKNIYNGILRNRYKVR